MSTTQPISDLVLTAKKQLVNKIINTGNRRFTLSPEEFGELFITRAKEVLFEHKTFSDFIIDESNKNVINLLYFYAVRNQTKINSLAGIILNGAYGCGKSVMISAFCRILNDINFTEEKIEEIHAIELAENIKANGVLAYLKKPLLIQDLGKERNSVNSFGNVFNPLSDLLAIRAEYGSMTFGSTNMDMKMFTDHYKEYITKRIVEHVNLIYLPGGSRRPDYSINQK